MSERLTDEDFGVIEAIYLRDEEDGSFRRALDAAFAAGVRRASRAAPDPGEEGLRKTVTSLAQRWEERVDRPSAWGPGWDEASCLHAQALRAALAPAPITTMPRVTANSEPVLCSACREPITAPYAHMFDGRVLHQGCVVQPALAATGTPDALRKTLAKALDGSNDGPATCSSPWCGQVDDHTGECDSALIDWWSERDALRAALRSGAPAPDAAGAEKEESDRG